MSLVMEMSLMLLLLLLVLLMLFHLFLLEGVQLSHGMKGILQEDMGGNRFVL